MSKAKKQKTTVVAVTLPNEIVRMLDEMVKESYDSRSGFLRRLVLKEAKLLGKLNTFNTKEDEQ